MICPEAFAELLAVRLLALFRSGFDGTACLEGLVDAVLVGSLDTSLNLCLLSLLLSRPLRICRNGSNCTLGSGGCIRLLLRGVTRSGEGDGCGCTATLEDNGKPLEDTFWEMFCRH